MLWVNEKRVVSSPIGRAQLPSYWLNEFLRIRGYILTLAKGDNILHHMMASIPPPPPPPPPIPDSFSAIPAPPPVSNSYICSKEMVYCLRFVDKAMSAMQYSVIRLNTISFFYNDHSSWKEWQWHGLEWVNGQACSKCVLNDNNLFLFLSS